jgi:GT2 family glycosyltransferase
MDEHDYALAGMLTRIKDTSKYLAFCNNERWKFKITEGPKSVVGSPFMIKAQVLKEIPFNTTKKFSDDTDLCERIIKAGYQIGYSDVICYESLDNSYEDLKRRFKIYGISDAEVYNAHKDEWTRKRKWQSLLHPYRSEFKVILSGVKGFWTKVKVFPYALLITGIRYRSWYKNRKNHVR